MIVYVVEHLYDVDGGFGDAISENDIVAAFETEEEAEAFVAKYSDVHVYDRPYASLRCGELAVTTIETGKYDESEFWWLDEDNEDDD